MSVALLLLTCLAAWLTSLLSSVLGMAGGMVLMGYLAWVAPVAAAMVLHGSIQALANGHRAWINRRDIGWRMVSFYLLGTLCAMGLLAALQLSPSKVVVYLALGIVPFAALAVPIRYAPDLTKPWVAVLCGFSVVLLQLTAGVAGSLLDVFFARSQQTRYQVVADKAVTQSLSHLAKLVYFLVLLRAPSAEGAGWQVPWWGWPALLLSSMLGTEMGRPILDRMSDSEFRRYTQWLVLAIGVLMLARGLWLAWA